MICGPKSSGKSTFAKLLINQLLTSSMSTFEQVTTVPRELRTPGVAFLDVDPGQPEYAPPGQVSLVYITEPNFGPPYTHPNASNAGRECIRAHSIASSSSASNTALYLACVTDLLFHYRLLKSKKKCPLVINTPGWVLGTGLELLAEIIQKASLTGVIYMSQEGPYDVVQSLRHVAGSIPFVTLPSQPTDFTARTAAHQRSMQVMSYLHFRLEREAKESWDPNPLVSMPPLMLKYTGNNAGIFGLMCQGEQPLAEMIIDRINGTLVAVVVIDDMAFIPGLTGNFVDPDSDDHSQGFRFSDWKTSHKWTSESEFVIDDKIEKKIIIRTPELIPYFNPKLPISIDPRHSHTIGLALIRGVDVKRRRFHLLTPIPLSSLENVTSLGKRIILVSGNLDTPGWAYTEQLCQRTGIRKGREYQAARLSDQDAEDGGDTTTSQTQGSIEADLECAPWVDKVRGDQSRGVGAKAWRVRRDLGKNSSDKDQAS
jgi:polynucleotide 5'-hydroxyl-kinase GRC3/NOL9